ncbi:protein kinase [Phytoactinopolyspora halotolerans]|uniref:non-specific serine/threonine protein kinase n=2 Tax=Phytoactinopolyspora halotolerans TaxID=1981512 RepID=A0A6L9S3W8_9ACTN|nr:protein kinase [Phytoactinopolyspora halotolerans]
MYGTGVLLANRYRLDQPLGQGGMGEVWRATDQVLGRIVAVKVMRPQLVAQPGFAERFLAEARAMATVKHPAIVNIYDYQGDSSEAFLVMEVIEGEPLSNRLQRMGRLSPAATMALVAQTAEALQAAHDKGIVHRDVKPGNLLITADDRVVLTDFGIARFDASAQLTATGQVIGTPSYLAPEQVLGHRATPQSDVYALGVVAYECLSGRLPFSGENSYAVATQRLTEPPAPMDPDVPAGVATVVQRALASEARERWSSAHDLADAARAAAKEPGAPPANLAAFAVGNSVGSPPGAPSNSASPAGPAGQVGQAGHAGPAEPPPPAPYDAQATQQADHAATQADHTAQPAQANRPVQPTAATQPAPPAPGYQAAQQTQATQRIDQTAPTVRVPQDPNPTPPTQYQQPAPVQSPTPVQPAPTRHAPPVQRAQPRRSKAPAERSRPRRPQTMLVAGLLLCLVAISLSVYAGLLWSLRPDFVEAVEDRVEGGMFEMLAGAAPMLAWTAIAAYGFLTVMFVLLGVLTAAGSRATRSWTFTFGFITLLIAAPLGIVGALAFNRMEPSSPFRRALLSLVPPDYPDYITMAGVAAMGLVLIAMLLMMTRPVNAHISGRGR